MSDTVQPSDEPALDPPGDLARAVAAVLPGWLERLVVATATRGLGGCPPELRAAAAAMAGREAPRLASEVERFLGADVDAQRGTPLTILRSAVAGPTALLRDAGVPPARRDDFAERTFPDDVYGLGPATWSDVDPSLHEPGLVWGAWKAATVLRRRREEGRR